MDWLRDHLWEAWLGAGHRARRRRDVQPRPDPADARRRCAGRAWSPPSSGCPSPPRSWRPPAPRWRRWPWSAPRSSRRLHGGPDLMARARQAGRPAGPGHRDRSARPRTRPGQAGRRDLDRRALRRAADHRAGRDRRGPRDPRRDGLRPPGARPRVLESTPDVLVGPGRSPHAAARGSDPPRPAGPVRRRAARSRPCGSCRRPAPASSSGSASTSRRCPPASTSWCRSSTGCATSSTCASRS